MYGVYRYVKRERPAIAKGRHRPLRVMDRDRDRDMGSVRDIGLGTGIPDLNLTY